MSPLDAAIVVLVLTFALLGATRGLAAGGLALIGFTAGAIAGSRIGALLAEGAEDARIVPAVTLFAGLVLGGLAAVALERFGLRLRERLARHRAGRLADGVGGAALFAVLALAMVWALAAVALRGPGGGASSPLGRIAGDSRIVAALDEALPSPDPLLEALRRVAPTPTLAGPDPSVPPPDAGRASDPDIREASRSVVRVTGVACGIGLEGSGWVAGDGLVVTNAHVVAGQTDTLVESVDGQGSDAEVVAYEPENDIAVLSAPDLDLPPLELDSEPARGDSGAVAGFPENGPLTLVPARLGTTAEVSSQDSYGRGPIDRRMTAFRAEVRSGNSGGPVIDGDGRVMATVFAASESAGPPSGLGVPNDVVADRLGGRLEPTSPGRCGTSATLGR